MDQPRRSSRIKNKEDADFYVSVPTKKLTSIKFLDATTGKINKECDNSAPLRRSTRTFSKQAADAIKKVLASESQGISFNDSSDFDYTLPNYRNQSPSSSDDEVLEPVHVYDSMARKKKQPSEDCADGLSEYEKRIAENIKMKADFLSSLQMRI